MQAAKKLPSPSSINDKREVTLESISKLANTMAGEMGSAIKKIQDINEDTHILALNAAIEASSAGDAGKGFGVVAEHMGILSNETSKITQKMSLESQAKVAELDKTLNIQATNVRGDRLANLALTNIDLIDRNLYERTADVRWWATESSVVNALTEKTKTTYANVATRFAIILKFYTVYHDLILCDLEGNILANGNPKRANVIGRNVLTTPWFQCTLQTTSGEEYGFESVHKSRASNEHTMTFACKVHQGGNPNNKVIGVLATLFNWVSLAQNIVNETPINKNEKQITRICIVDGDGLVLADSDNRVLSDKIEFQEKKKLFAEKKNFIICNYNNKRCCIGHAFSPGYESYASRLHSIIIQELKEN